MKTEDLSPKRRLVLKWLGSAIAVTPLTSLIACSGGGGDSTVAQTGQPNNDTGSGETGGGVTGGENNTDWLSGGTSAMQVEFPPSTDPFDSGLGNMCSITDQFTIGPCYFDSVEERDDISEGQAGVPMTLVMKLVDSQCQPISGAVIEVWWCNAEGQYSGDDSASNGNVSNFNAGFCTGNDSDALNARWFRGIKTSDENGNTYFQACFPGWYPSRTTHIHFRIVLNGNQQLISQFAFDDDLSNEIYMNHSDYTGQAKDTSNNSDTVFDANTVDEYLFEVERQSDGSMLAYKAIQLAAI